MTGQRLTSTFQAVNLFRNGHFDLLTEAGVPAFWTVKGAIENQQPNALAETSYRVLTGQSLAVGPERVFELTLRNSSPVRLLQVLTRDASQVFDFPVPLPPGQRESILAGHPGKFRLLIDDKLDHTLAFSYRVKQGVATLQPVATDATLDDGSLTTFMALQSVEGGADPRTVRAEQTWRRAAFPFQCPNIPSSLGLQIARAPGSDLCVVEVSLFSFTRGAFNLLPYLGDPFQRCFPEGTIVLTMGEGCPPGFEELGDGDLEPLPEWTAYDSSVRARKGNFPRSSTELTGTELHGTEVVQIEPGTSDVERFITSTSKTVVEDNDNKPYAGSNPTVDAPGGVNNTPDHPHTFEAAPTRPVSRGFRFCKRL